MSFIRSVAVVGIVVYSTFAHAELSHDDFQSYLAFVDKLSDVVVADKHDCPKMARDMNERIDANKDLIARVKKAGQTKAISKRMTDAMMEKCSNDHAVQAAFKRLPGLTE